MHHKITLIGAIFAILCLSATAQTYTRLTNLPHVYIETENHVAITSKEIYVNATMVYVDEEDVVTQYDGMQIRGRGNSTWNLSKKPYKIKFQEKEKFLGVGYAKAKKWTLLANAGDKTLMRNAITSLMGDFLGLKNNPAHKFVDLTLNGVYQGNYQISDQVDVRPHRVNIVEQDYPLTEESDITGGYLLEVDGFKDGNYFTTSRYQLPITIHYPEDDEIVASQNNYIRKYINDFETVLASENFADAENGYRSWVDSTSLVNWFIATEVSGNVDGYWSSYFYKDQQDPLLYFGPLWDYDIAYNNDNRTDRQGTSNTEQQLMTDAGYGATKNWLNRMWEDPWFGRLVNRRYAEAIDAGLKEYMYEKIDSISALLQESQKLNYQKWGIKSRAYHERVLYSSYDQYVEDIKTYLAIHMPYLQTAFANKKVSEPTPPFEAEDYYYTISNADNGRVFDVYNSTGKAGDLICSWQPLSTRISQQWEFVHVGDYYQIVNRNDGMALNDPTSGTATATTNVGTQLNTATPDATSDRQLWSLVPQGTQGYYNIINKYTNHTANQNGGSSSNGTSIISYNTDSRNSTSLKRLWYIIPGEAIERIEPDAIAAVEPDEYALAYNPQSKVLHFGAEMPEQLVFTAKIYSSNGTFVRSFKASEPCSVADLPLGVYIVNWRVDGKTRSTKLLIP